MKTRILASLIILAGLLTTHAWPQSIKPTGVEQKVSLVSGNNKITYIELTNTHSRTTRLESSGYQLTVEEHVKGVIWKLRCIGVAIENPFETIILKDETGQPFRPVTNTITTIGRRTTYDQKGNVLYDGPATVFYLIGPDDSKTVQVFFGDASVKIKIAN